VTLLIFSLMYTAYYIQNFFEINLFQQKY